MDLVRVLDDDRDRIIDQAAGAMARVDAPHYRSEDETFERLAVLFDRLLATIARRDLEPIVTYTREAAQLRFDAGVDLAEIQTAINVLEETIWSTILDTVSEPEQAQSLGLVSTALGAAKDEMARTYVSLATRRHVPSLDLTRLYAGV